MYHLVSFFDCWETFVLPHKTTWQIPTGQTDEAMTDLAFPLCLLSFFSEQLWHRWRRWYQLVWQRGWGPKAVWDLRVSFAEFLQSEPKHQRAASSTAKIGPTSEVQPPVGPGRGQHRALRLWRWAFKYNIETHTQYIYLRTGFQNETPAAFSLLFLYIIFNN